MPRRWTNADQYNGADPKSLRNISTELRNDWSAWQQENAIRYFRNTYTQETT
ncbi:hypothetical protein [Microbacterium sp. SD291]|uniref:hypothetical protein n=1 Tax=Microbacterium sp. SD291 TaxID=2782007 RepID=UPI001A97BC86|nr:hypothetical protein [Microbacterium sp. SD291]MBO0979899.1 hypothetical protein [Microbacterium sp. SD291]